MNRRQVLKAGLLGAAALVLSPGFARESEGTDATARLAQLERRHGGRLGVAIIDTADGRQAMHRADERFLMCSTFKLLAVAATLARVDRGAERLDRRIVFAPSALLAYAPVTRQHVGEPGMRVGELCRAAITVSDNTAANLLLASMGGPSAVTSFVRSIGDPVTRLDRIEPGLNVGSPGDMRDTTTPRAMVATMRQMLLNDVLAEGSRRQLIAWLRACETGREQLRAGFPRGWVAGDKTGSGSHGETNDVAVVWPPGRKPLLVAAYYADSPASATERKRVLAEVGRIAASM
ncbi:MAG: class A beta-lactamase [Pseudomonadota bacterium]|nr:class A beta-lactamase [Pseudomonadota bacterium]